MAAPTATTWKLLKFVEVVALPLHSWFLVNANQLGFYRVNYDEKNWRALVSALLENPEAFSSATKAQLIDDSLNMARVGLMSYDTAIDLFIVLARTEMSYSMWNAATRNLLQLSFLLQPTEAYENFKVSDETSEKTQLLFKECSQVLNSSMILFFYFSFFKYNNL